MSGLLKSENGNYKEVPAIKWLLSNAKELQDIYIQDIDIYGPGHCKVVVHVTKYRTFSTSALEINTAKELFEDVKFNHVAKHY